MCITIRNGGVLFSETSYSTVGHHKLSNSHEEFGYQGTVNKAYMTYAAYCATRKNVS